MFRLAPALQILGIGLAAWLLLGSVAAAGLLSPEAIMYGLSPSEVDSLSVQEALSTGSSAAPENRSPSEHAPGYLDRLATLSPLSASGNQTGAAGSGTERPGVDGSSAERVSASDLGKQTLVSYLHQHPSLLLPTPFLDGVFRPPRCGSSC